MAPYEDHLPKHNGEVKNGEYSPLTSSNAFADEDEKLLHLDRLARPKSRWSKAWKIIRLSLEFIGLLLLVLNFFILLNFSRPVTGPDPRISSGPLNQHWQYGSDPRYMSFDHKYDYLWKEAFSQDYGEVALPPFKDAEGLYSKDRAHNEGGIGMYHAFHCLASMRTAFQKMGEGKLTLAQLQKGDHAAHCFDYIRNVILCFADDTFELARNKTGHPWGGAIEGQWDVRTCRDHIKLEQIMEKYGKWRRHPVPVYDDIVGIHDPDPPQAQLPEGH
ncbi:hypothetical protein BU23DRAFT_629087 [Bimuria novae-zelandiae CBS 107.79]|uniref:Uncharacterized protein n=1 Tax=Bimuria novae-zelandiae CBS 107.79 TaxID=1447943 RepID=A0A6A5UJN1_9PLEO|nr:hypothetical protein BU23DRAFT_629087 [Bimuria novae-zelandiae CBS 107.79]